jgi:Triphosphoribosyl-dephospho-CoA synthetase
MAATVAAVGTNTNLGILLLAAPMLAASERGGAFRPALEAVLRDLDIGDAEEVFAAIRVASPAGLGDAERHDVTAPATVGLREAMAEAADRDRIARQYVTGFSDVLDLGLAEAEAARALGLPPEQVTTAVYFRFAGAFPDSHIVRKFGISAAEAVRRSFVEQAQSLRPYDHDALMTFDADLKARGLNPGTSADLTVATELALRIC